MKRFRLPSRHSLAETPPAARLLIAQQFCEGFVPIAALYAIMFERVGGLDFTQIGWLFAIWSLAYLAAELPSGVLADYWSRRNVIAIGGLFRAIGFAIWIAKPDFTGYAIGFALWGVAIACTSGAAAAYLHDELRADGRERHFARYFGWSMSAGSVGSLAGFGLAAALTLDHADTLTALSVISSMLFAILFALAPERPYKRQATYFATLASGFREIGRSRKLRYVCVILFSTYMTIGVLEELLPRLYAGFGMSDRIVALLTAAALLVSVFLLARLEDFVRFSLAKQVLVMAGGMALLLAGLTAGGISGSLLILTFSLVFQLLRSVFIHHVQDVAETDDRATIGSIPGLAAGLLGAGAYALIGIGAGASSENISIGIYAIVWLALFLILAYAGRGLSVSAHHTVADPEVARPPRTLP